MNSPAAAPGAAHVTEFQVTGMSCGHCERAIRDEVAPLPGVIGVEVSAASGKLTVSAAAAPADDQTAVAADAAVLAAVIEAGYEAKRIA